MSDSKNLLDWFGKRKAGMVENGARDHALTVLDAVIELGLAFSAMSEGNGAKAMKCVGRLVEYEREADRIEDRLSAKLTGGDLGPQEREDLLRFVRKLDTVANWSKEASIHLQLSKETGAEIPPEIWAFLRGMASELEKEVRILIDAVEALSAGDFDESIRCVEAVKDQERVIDGMNAEGIRRIHLSPMDMKGILFSRDMVHAVEEASDTAKGCADTIMILVTARRK
ncbi:MAG: DUF47 domain-containing protein [Candidatus Methanomethylophilaceae archaeon]